MVEQPAVNRRVAGSSPASGADPSLEARRILARFSGTLARRTLGPIDSEPARLLLIEDNQRHAQLFQIALGEVGVVVAGAPPYELYHATSLGEGLDRLEAGEVDLVLLDLSLPEGDGLEPLIELRERFLDVPVVALTPHGDDLLPGQALQAGAQDYLTKGKISGELLARTIRHAIEVNRLQTALRRLSFLDGLTGLYNRQGFVMLAEPHLKLAQRAKGKFLVVSVDVGGLDAINQTVGFEEGDRVLRDVAQILRVCFRDSDLIARLDGGTFAALAADAPADKATVISRRIEQHVREYNGLTLRSYTLQVSVGCSVFDDAEAPPIEDLLARAAEARLGLRPPLTGDAPDEAGA